MVSAVELLARVEGERVKAVTVAGIELHMRRLSLTERIDIGTRVRAGDALGAHEYLSMGLCNEDGSALFTRDEAKAFADADGWLAEQFVNAVLGHNRLTAAAQEQLAKN